MQSGFHVNVESFVIVNNPLVSLFVSSMCSDVEVSVITIGIVIGVEEEVIGVSF